TVGMLFMSGAMPTVGLFGSPRRTSFSTYGDNATALGWSPYLLFLAVGGSLVIVAVVLMVYIAFYLMFNAPKGHTEFPIGEPEDNALNTPMWSECWGLWVILMMAVVALGYVVAVVDLIMNASLGLPKLKTS